MDNALAQRLIKARSIHGWSQADLAESSGVAAAQISRYEQGRTTPRPPVVAKLAKALGVRFEWLAFGQDDTAGKEPGYPPVQVKRVEIEVEDALHAAVQQFAQRTGMAYEVLCVALMREMLERFDRHPDDLADFLKRQQSP
ncbi:MAG: helix-turn-helix domain-containing protein [Delftia acidovorans]|jgi:transcriptional regulator with XRE-family HTH domain|nr:helix-turn-helix domain-containing protein [Delftia acidovorans]